MAYLAQEALIVLLVVLVIVDTHQDPARLSAPALEYSDGRDSLCALLGSELERVSPVRVQLALDNRRHV